VGAADEMRCARGPARQSAPAVIDDEQREEDVDVQRRIVEEVRVQVAGEKSQRRRDDQKFVRPRMHARQAETDPPEPYRRGNRQHAPEWDRFARPELVEGRGQDSWLDRLTTRG